MLAKTSGDGFEKDTKWGSRNSNNNVGFGGDGQWMADVNGDGKADYVYNRDKRHEYWVMLTKSQSPTSVTMIVAADPQFFWGGHDLSVETNQAQINAMNSFLNPINRLSWPSALPEGGGVPVEEPLGVIINGDLTAFFHGKEFNEYKNFFHENLNYLIFPGLGNHDYCNNADVCYRNGCAKDAIQYIKETLTGDDIFYFNQALENSYDESSLAYSFKIGNFHFFQLHNKPSYSNKSGEDISCSLQWLEKKLGSIPNGEKAIINVHDGYGALNDSACYLYGKYGELVPQNVNTKDCFRTIVERYSSKIIGIFAGHLHNSFGKIGTVPDTSIPIFLSGAPISVDTKSQIMTFLLVNFTETYMNVGVIHYEIDEKPIFYSDTLGKDLNTYYY